MSNENRKSPASTRQTIRTAFVELFILIINILSLAGLLPTRWSEIQRVRVMHVKKHRSSSCQRKKAEDKQNIRRIELSGASSPWSGAPNMFSPRTGAPLFDIALHKLCLRCRARGRRCTYFSIVQSLFQGTACERLCKCDMRIKTVDPRGKTRYNMETEF